MEFLNMSKNGGLFQQKKYWPVLYLNRFGLKFESEECTGGIVLKMLISKLEGGLPTPPSNLEKWGALN